MRSDKMNLVHDETVKIVFDEEFIVKLLTDHAVSDYYNLKYNGFTKRSVSINNDGRLTVEILYDKVIRNDLEVKGEGEGAANVGQ